VAFSGSSLSSLLMAEFSLGTVGVMKKTINPIYNHYYVTHLHIQEVKQLLTYITRQTSITLML